MFKFIPFYWFDQKSCLNKSKFSSGFSPFQTWYEKTNFLNISVIVTESITFISKKKNFYEFLQKCFKTTDRHSLAVCGSICRENRFLLIFILFTGLFKNNCLNKSKFSVRIFAFQIWKENKLSEYISGRFGDSHFYV